MNSTNTYNSHLTHAAIIFFANKRGAGWLEPWEETVLQKHQKTKHSKSAKIARILLGVPRNGAE